VCVCVCVCVFAVCVCVCTVCVCVCVWLIVDRVFLSPEEEEGEGEEGWPRPPTDPPGLTTAKGHSSSAPTAAERYANNSPPSIFRRHGNPVLKHAL